MNSAPVTMQWDGEALKPVSGFWQRRADKQFVIGERYAIAEHHERSGASHRHYFAHIQDAWANLPENLAVDFPNPEKLRKWALIKAGYCTEQKLICRENKDAIQASVILSAMDAFAICNVTDSIVTVWRAQSQSVRAMGAKEFQKSKDEVLHVISDLIGSDVTERNQVAA